jgi:hypothetical protein
VTRALDALGDSELLRRREVTVTVLDRVGRDEQISSARMPSSAPGGHVPTKHRIFTVSFASVYPLYVAKAEKKGGTKAEVDAIICWLTGYSQKELEKQLKKQVDFETFFREAPVPNPSRRLIKGVVCGVRLEEIQEPTMREIRYLDKLVDELAKGKAMDKILRSDPAA